MAAVGPFKATLSHCWEGDTDSKVGIPVEAAIVRYASRDDISLTVDSSSISPKTPSADECNKKEKKTKTPSPHPRRRNPRRSCAIETTAPVAPSATITTTTKPSGATKGGPARKVKSSSRTMTKSSSRATSTRSKPAPPLSSPTPPKSNGRKKAGSSSSSSSSSSRKETKDGDDASGNGGDDDKKKNQVSPIFLLTLKASSSPPGAGQDGTGSAAVLAAYQIIGNPSPCRQDQLLCLTTSAADGARVSFSVCSGGVPTYHDAAITRRVGTRGQPAQTICLVKSYEESKSHATPSRRQKKVASNNPSPNLVLSFPSLVESQLFQRSLISASRLDACSSLGSVAIPNGSVGGGGKGGEMERFDKRRERANALADEMLVASVPVKKDIETKTTVAAAPTEPPPAKKKEATVGDDNASSEKEKKKKRRRSRDDEVDDKEASKKKRAAIPSAVGVAPVGSSEEDDFFFVLPEDVTQMTDYIFLLMAQAKRGIFSEHDQTSGHRKKSASTGALVVGSLGMRCRHCGGQNSGSYFATTTKNLNGAASNLHTHLLKCGSCPDSIKTALERAKSTHWSQLDDLRGNANGSCWMLLFERIRSASYDGGDPTSQAIVKVHLEGLVGSLVPKKDKKAINTKVTAKEDSPFTSVDGVIVAAAKAPETEASSPAKKDKAASQPNHPAAKVRSADEDKEPTREKALSPAAKTSPPSASEATPTAGVGTTIVDAKESITATAVRTPSPILNLQSTTMMLESMVSPVRRTESKCSPSSMHARSPPTPDLLDLDNFDLIFEALEEEAQIMADAPQPVGVVAPATTLNQDQHYKGQDHGAGGGASKHGKMHTFVCNAKHAASIDISSDSPMGEDGEEETAASAVDVERKVATANTNPGVGLKVYARSPTHSEGSSSNEARDNDDTSMLTTPRKTEYTEQHPTSMVSAGQPHATQMHVHEDYAAPIEADSDDLRTPTKNFLKNLFAAESGMTPFSLLSRAKASGSICHNDQSVVMNERDDGSERRLEPVMETEN